jgi:hypothetical protein
MFVLDETFMGPPNGEYPVHGVLASTDKDVTIVRAGI